MPDAKQWFGRTVLFLEGYRQNLGKQVDMFVLFRNIGWTLTFALFVYAIANANYFYRQDDYWQILGRLIIAVGLISGGPAINITLQNTWEELHDFSQEEFAASTNDSLMDSLFVMAQSLPSFLLGIAAVDKLSALEQEGITASR